MQKLHVVENIFIKEWDSILNASNELKICKVSISACCRNKKETAGNFIWEFKK